MKLSVRTTGMRLRMEEAEHLERRLQFALGRFDDLIAWVRVYLTDENGPRGGADKHCRLVVKVLPSMQLLLEDQDADLTVLIDRAADRLAQLIRRHLERRRNHRVQVPAFPY